MRANQLQSSNITTTIEPSFDQYIENHRRELSNRVRHRFNILAALGGYGVATTTGIIAAPSIYSIFKHIISGQSLLNVQFLSLVLAAGTGMAFATASLAIAITSTKQILMNALTTPEDSDYQTLSSKETDTCFAVIKAVLFKKMWSRTESDYQNLSAAFEKLSQVSTSLTPSTEVEQQVLKEAAYALEDYEALHPYHHFTEKAQIYLLSPNQVDEETLLILYETLFDERGAVKDKETYIAYANKFTELNKILPAKQRRKIWKQLML